MRRDTVSRQVQDHAAPRKLRLDFKDEASMGAFMSTPPPSANLDLIAGLCLEAGRIMEDESVALALTLPTSTGSIAERLERTRQAGEDIVALAAAAQVLLRRNETSL
jgi:hypothetical protein